METIRA